MKAWTSPFSWVLIAGLRLASGFLRPPCRRQRCASFKRDGSSFRDYRRYHSTERTSGPDGLSAEAKNAILDLSASSLRGYSRSTGFAQAKQILKEFLDSTGTADVLYDSIAIPPGASSKPISDGDLAIQTRLVNRRYKITELIELSGNRDANTASIAVLCVMIGSTTSALVANQSLPGPEIVRFIVVWLFSFAPLMLAGYGIADVDAVQSALVMVQRRMFPAFRQRMIQHEAGHFLMGHLLGWPIKGYAANAVKNAVEFFPFADSGRGRERARQLGFVRSPAARAHDDDDNRGTSAVPFYSDDGRGGRDTSPTRLVLENQPTSTWPFRGFSEDDLDRLAVISVAGVCAEILAYGNAEGGVADLNQMRQIFSSADVPLSEREIDSRIRFALAFALTQLRRHLGALDALVSVMERGGTVEECIVSIESCGNVSGQNGILGDYELRRRKRIQRETTSRVERLLLGRQKSIDDVEDRLVEGRGGGGMKESRFQLTGDDPVYAAVAVSMCFLFWASNGGLTLH
jgi:hypothetical protein